MSAARARMLAKKAEEGDQHKLAAERCLQTSWLKWSPDVQGAVLEYGKAAACYRNAKQHEKAKIMYLNTAKCQRQVEMLFSAAKNVANAALMCVELKELAQAARLNSKAALLYQQDSHNQSAADLLLASAKLLHEELPEQASMQLREAINCYEADSKEYVGIDAYKLLVSICIREKHFSEALKTLHRMAEVYAELNQQHNVHETYLETVIIHLFTGDHAEAQAALDRFTGESADFVMTTEYELLSVLIQRLLSDDEEALQEFVKEKIHVLRESYVARMVRQLHVFGSEHNPLNDLLRNAETQGEASEQTGDGFDEDQGYCSDDLL